MSENVLFNLSIPKQLKKQLEEKAKSQGVTLSGYIRMVLINSLK